MGKWVNGFWDQETQLLGIMSEGPSVRCRWRGGGGQEFSLYMLEVQGMHFTALIHQCLEST